MTRARASRIAVVASGIAISLVLAGTAAGGGASLTDPVRAQIEDFLALYAGDAWVATRLVFIRNLCDGQEKTYTAARERIAAAGTGLDAADRERLARLDTRFDRLAREQVELLQEIVLHEVETRRPFDPNFTHNLVARAAVDAWRLTRDEERARAADRGAGEAAVRRFDERFGALRDALGTLRREVLSADPPLLDPARRASLARAFAGERARIADENGAPTVVLADPSAFASFWEAVDLFYDDDFAAKRRFADRYELMLYLLEAEAGGSRPNAPFAVGPFRLSRLTEELTRPARAQPITLVTAAYFARGAIAPEARDADSLSFLAATARQTIADPALPPRTRELRRFLRSAPRGSRGPAREIPQEAYENRLFVLTAMSDQAFFERYRSVRNDTLFFDRAERALGLADLKGLLAEPYAVPGGDFVLPRYELLGYTGDAFAGERAPRAILERIPRQVHIDFIRPLILTIYQRLAPAERDAMARSRVGEIARHFGTEVGVVGDQVTFEAFTTLFRADLEAAAAVVARDAEVSSAEAMRWLLALLAIESRGHLFAVSPTGALGPFQHTYHFYLRTEPPSIPFAPRASALKTGRELARYVVGYRARHRVEALDLALAAYNQGPGAVDAALAKGDWRRAIAPEGRRYVERFHGYVDRVREAGSTEEIVRGIAAAL